MRLLVSRSTNREFSCTSRNLRKNRTSSEDREFLVLRETCVKNGQYLCKIDYFSEDRNRAILLKSHFQSYQSSIINLCVRIISRSKVSKNTHRTCQTVSEMKSDRFHKAQHILIHQCTTTHDSESCLAVTRLAHNLAFILYRETFPAGGTISFLPR